MSDQRLKWVDVAHHYMITHVNGEFYQWWLKVPNEETVYDAIPILRHRDDMTDAEKKTHFDALAEIYASGGNVPIGWETHSLASLGIDVFGLIESGQAIRK